MFRAHKDESGSRHLLMHSCERLEQKLAALAHEVVPDEKDHVAVLVWFDIGKFEEVDAGPDDAHTLSGHSVVLHERVARCLTEGEQMSSTVVGLLLAGVPLGELPAA